jgi:hypothetical protein
MNFARSIERKKSRRELDVELLERVLRPSTLQELSEGEADAFRNMLSRIGNHDASTLTTKQRNWAEGVDKRLAPIAAALVPTGKHVETPWMLRRENLPLRPPHRRHEVEQK